MLGCKYVTTHRNKVMLIIFMVITFVDLVTMALFANVTSDSRQWMAAQLAA
jgi:hypothetical protein